jgi:hypothetical protein
MFWTGLQRESSSIKWAKIRKKKGLIRIEQLETLPIGNDVKQLYFTKDKREQTSITVISGLETNHLLLRDLKFKIQEKRKILNLVPFQIESQIPYPIEESIVALQLFPKKETKETDVSLFAAKAASLQEHIDRWNSLGIESDEISCEPVALARFINHFFPEVKKSLILHIGTNSSTAAYIVKNKVIFSHPFPLTLDLFLEKDLDQIKKDQDRFFSFLFKKIPLLEEEKMDVILTGNSSSASSKLWEFIYANLPPELSINKTPIQDPSYDTTTLKAYAIPIGLAIDGLVTDGLSIEFRKGISPSLSSKKKKAKAFLTLALAVCTLTVSTFILQNIYLHQKKQVLLSAFKEEFDPSSINSIKKIGDLEEKLSTIEAGLKKDKTPYPLAPAFPNISEILAYFSNFPPTFEIKKINYSLVKYPKADSPKSPYEGRIDLEIETKEARDLLLFEQKILKKSPFINTKKEITKETKDNTHTISFFLKPKPGPSS